MNPALSQMTLKQMNDGSPQSFEPNIQICRLLPPPLSPLLLSLPLVLPLVLPLPRSLFVLPLDAFTAVSTQASCLAAKRFLDSDTITPVRLSDGCGDPERTRF